MVQLNEDLIRELDVEAERRGTSRSDVIRQAVAVFLAESRRDHIGEQIAEGYSRIPPGTPDEWGDIEAIADRSARELGQRLAAEERSAGLDRW